MAENSLFTEIEIGNYEAGKIYISDIGGGKTPDFLQCIEISSCVHMTKCKGCTGRPIWKGKSTKDSRYSCCRYVGGVIFPLKKEEKVECN